MKQLNQGSALMVVLVVVSVMTTISLAGARVLMIQFQNIRDFASSRTAFYAAEAGLEKGLLAYRANRADEIDAAKINFNQGAAVSHTSYYKDRQDQLGIMEKDTAYQMDVFPVGADILTYNWQGNGRVKVTKIRSDGSLQPEGDLKISPGGSSQFDANFTGFRFHVFQDDIANFSLSCVQDKCLSKKDYTIDSQASFRGISRHLEAKIDRQSGLLQSLFDYTLFSQGEIR